MDVSELSRRTEVAVFEARLHGRGGQGVVTMAELLALAAFHDGHEAQAFPSFGSERMGAPVMSFCRVADEPIRLREPVMEPDAVVIADPTLLHHVDVFAGLSSRGFVLLNSSRSVTELGLQDLLDRVDPSHVVTVPASDLAVSLTGRSLPGSPLLGALAALTAVTSMDAIAAALASRFSTTVALANVAAAQAGFDTIMQRRVGVDA